MVVEENRPLAPFTTFGIGGPARWFLEAQTEQHVCDAAAWAQQQGVPLFVLGGGSNLLVADRGFEGLIVHIALRGMTETTEGADPLVRVAAGEDWDAVVKAATEAGYAGIECLAGIPGTAGGTPVQNVGAYGQEVSSTIHSARAFDVKTHSFVHFANADCGFAYRQSRFNSVDRGRYVITEVEYRLVRNGAPMLAYADLKTIFPEGAKPKVTEVADAVRAIRRRKGMLLDEGDPDCRSAGSFFKNPVVTIAQADTIASMSGASLPRYPAGLGHDRVKIPAAWLIEQAGFRKGYARGAAGISSRHTLALVNRGGALAADILGLAEEVRSAVRERFAIELEMEPVLLGF